MREKSVRSTIELSIKKPEEFKKLDSLIDIFILLEKKILRTL